MASRVRRPNWLLCIAMLGAAPAIGAAQAVPLPRLWVGLSGGLGLVNLSTERPVDRTAGQAVLGVDAGIRIALGLGLGILGSIGVPVKAGDCVGPSQGCSEQSNSYISGAGLLMYSLGRRAPTLSAGAGTFRFDNSEIAPSQTRFSLLGAVELPLLTTRVTAVSLGLRAAYLPDSSGEDISV
jgi:hypothetical protein